MSLPGATRFSRERVCTAVMPSSRLSTYIAQSSGWSKPVWYLLATISTWYSSPLKASRMSRPFRPGFIVCSLNGLGPLSGSLTSPEKATSAARFA